MCGIVGYVGKGDALPFLTEGLKRLEYRGYDSAGISILDSGKFTTIKKKGKLNRLDSQIKKLPSSSLGIAHNRWATHGEPSDANAHPHHSMNGKIAIVHNGIIENHQDIREELCAKGFRFKSETDSEVLAQLAQFYEDEGKCENFVEVIKKTVSRLTGTYGILFAHADHPDMLVGVRNGSPLCFGIGQDKFIVSSDVVAFAARFSQVVHLEDKEMVVIEGGAYRTYDFKGGEVEKKSESIDLIASTASKGEFEHFMIKEIFEQPNSVHRAMRGRLLRDEGNCKLGGLNMSVRDLLDVKSICFVGCGTSYHAGLLGVYLMESLARIPSTAEIAPELKYRNPIVRKNTLYIGISQSGETMDTNTTLQEIINKGGKAIGICNVVGSSMARMLGSGIYLHAGLEVSVCSTKAFTSQITAIYLLAIHLARSRDLAPQTGERLVNGLEAIPKKIKSLLQKASEIQAIAKKYAKFKNFLYMGRGINYAVAIEGALKLKEVAYVFAEGYSSSEMKHGAIALIDPECASIFICPDDELKTKNISNIEEVHSRKGRILAIVTEGDEEARNHADDVIEIPETEPLYTSYLAIVSLQLFAYYIALELGKDIDQPRNLAKSVTVE